jgi:hypothetical protein
VSTIKMDLVADDRRGSPGKRVKWVEDFDLEPETPGIYGVASDRGGQRAAAMYSLIVTALCRARHNEERF